MKFILWMLFIITLIGQVINKINFKDLNKNQKQLTDNIFKKNRKLKIMEISQIELELQNLHNQVTNCVITEFNKAPKDLLPYADLVTACVGVNFEVILKFYQDVNLEVKEITKENVKVNLKARFCDDFLFDCLTFYKIVELFIDKDFEILKTLEFNKSELEDQIKPENLSKLFLLVEKSLSNFDRLRRDLIAERVYVKKLIREEAERYKKMYGHDAINYGVNN